jgi:hypothetical protein
VLFRVVPGLAHRISVKWPFIPRGHGRPRARARTRRCSGPQAEAEPDTDRGGERAEPGEEGPDRDGSPVPASMSAGRDAAPSGDSG